LSGPPIPLHGLYLLGWWRQLRNRCRSTVAGMGAVIQEPITWPDIDAWMRLTGHTPAPWEIETITGLDDAWLRVQMGGSKAAAEE
jgi:hypothetical protein